MVKKTLKFPNSSKPFILCVKSLLKPKKRSKILKILFFTITMMFWVFLLWFGSKSQPLHAYHDISNAFSFARKKNPLPFFYIYDFWNGKKHEYKQFFPFLRPESSCRPCRSKNWFFCSIWKLFCRCKFFHRSDIFWWKRL